MLILYCSEHNVIISCDVLFILLQTTSLSFLPLTGAYFGLIILVHQLDILSNNTCAKYAANVTLVYLNQCIIFAFGFLCILRADSFRCRG